MFYVFITMSRGIKKVTEFPPITSLLVEILLISTSRQIRRMFFPLAMLHEANRSCPETTRVNSLKLTI